MLSIVTLNCNGLRSAIKKDFLAWVEKQNPDIICLQETKIHQRDLNEQLKNVLLYDTYYFSAEKPGYSGVAIWAKAKPKAVYTGIGIPSYDTEARIIRLEYEKLSVASVYFPSGTSGDERQTVKEQFLEDFFAYAQNIKTPIVFSGDFNIAHAEPDIHHPEKHHKYSGFLPHERKWFSKLLESGYTDAYRHIFPEKNEYSWFTYRANARNKNLGWRIDDHIVSNNIAPNIQNVKIIQDSVFSDHCPVLLNLNCKLN